MAAETKTCPFCFSDETYPDGFSRPANIWLIFLLGIAIPMRSNRWHCFNCNRKFTEKDIEKAATSPNEPH